MPELPEVETVKNKLLPLVKGERIENIEVRYSKYDCLNQVKGETINDIKRKGKYLIFVLDHYYMVSHLRMEGKYFIVDSLRENKHDHVLFTLTHHYMYYNDVRKFGVFHVFPADTDINSIEPLSLVGPEPFYATKEYLYQKLQESNEDIKPALLNQSIISGLGNIYVDETLYRSRVNPWRKAKSIRMDESEFLLKNAVIVLNKAIEDGGSTIKTFGSLNGEIGHFQLNLLVHLRENERCYNCSNIIIKGVCSGRGTYYCPTCEPKEPSRRIYAVTGGFSSGKSTVTGILKEKGYKTYSLDEIYNKLFKESKPMLREIKNAFGSTEKSKLREIVFHSEEKNNILKEITHKYVMKELFTEIDSSKDLVIFVEAPLLYEGHFEKCFTKVIGVKESEEVLKTLLKNKGFTLDDYKERNKSQLDRLEKIKRSDYVIHNDKDLKYLKKEVDKMLQYLEV